MQEKQLLKIDFNIKANDKRSSWDLRRTEQSGHLQLLPSHNTLRVSTEKGGGEESDYILI